MQSSQDGFAASHTESPILCPLAQEAAASTQWALAKLLETLQCEKMLNWPWLVPVHSIGGASSGATRCSSRPPYP